MKKTLLSSLLAATVILSGCAGRITPLTAQSLATLAVYEYGKSNPKVTKTMREIQPPVCLMATSEGATLADVVTQLDPAGSNPETKLLVTTLLSIFQTAVAPVGTNAPNQSPYLKAVFCDGWANGLALLPSDGVVTPPASLKRNTPPVKLPPGRWVRVK